MRFLSFHTEGDSVDFPFISKKSQPERTGTTLTVYEYGKALRHMFGQLAQLRKCLFDVPGAVFFPSDKIFNIPPISPESETKVFSRLRKFCKVRPLRGTAQETVKSDSIILDLLNAI